MRPFALSKDDIRNCWPDFEPLLSKFTAVRGDMSVEEIKAAAKDERMQLWGLQDGPTVSGLATTEICETPHGKICVIRIAVGEAPAEMQLNLLDHIGGWARSLGCKSVRYYGRKGWVKRFPRFREVGVIGEWNLQAH